MNPKDRLAVRLCGLASILAGVVWTGGTAFNVVVGGSIEPPNTLGAALALLATTLMVFAFIGIYGGQPGGATVIGLFGAGLGILGATLLSGVNTVAFAKSAGAVQVSRPPVEVGAPGILGLVLGVLLLGVEAVRSEFYGRWSGAPFILAAVLLLLRALNLDLSMLAILSASVGFVWLGWKVWSGAPVERPGDESTVAGPTVT